MELDNWLPQSLVRPSPIFTRLQFIFPYPITYADVTQAVQDNDSDSYNFGSNFRLLNAGVSTARDLPYNVMKDSYASYADVERSTGKIQFYGYNI